MKNFIKCLLLVAIVFLLGLSASVERYPVSPDHASVIFPDPVPCCYNFPPDQDALTNAMASVQPIYLGGQLALSLSKGQELQARM